MRIIVSTEEGYTLWRGSLAEFLRANPGEFNDAQSLARQLRDPGGKLLCGGGAAGVYYVEEVQS